MAKVYVSTTYAVVSLMIIVFALFFILINPFLSWSNILNAPRNIDIELGQLALLVFISFCFQLLLKLLGTVLTAYQKPALATALNLIANIISLIAIYVLTKTTSGSLIYLGLAISLPPVIVLLFSSFWIYSHEFRTYSPSVSHIDLGYIKSLMGLGIKFFILQIATLVLYQTSNIIIAHLFGSENVTLYNIAYKYFSVVPMIMLIVLMPLWSAFTDAWAKKEVDWIRNIIKNLNHIWIALCALVMIMLIMANMVYRLWVGNDLQVPYAISIALAFNIIINIGVYIYTIFLNGVGIIKVQLILSIIGMIISIPLAIFLGKIYGISGVISAYTLINVLNLGFYIIQYRKIINLRATGVWSK